MKIYESHPDMYVYKHLPGFARFLLQKHLDEFVQDQIRLSREINLPLLKFLSEFSEQQLTAFLKQSSIEYLTFLAENNAKAQLITSQKKWLSNDLKIIGKNEISSQDVTLINYVRSKLFKKWIRQYPVATEEKFDLADEIDNFFFGSITSGTDTLIDILKETIANESHFNAQLINTSPGIIFIFDVEKQKDIYINGNVNNIMGYLPEEIMAMGEKMLALLTHPDDVPILIEAFEKISQDTAGKTYQVEYRFKHKNGTYKWLRTYHTAFKRNAEGKPIELLGTAFEVTGEKEIATALSNREAQLLQAQAIAHLGSFEWDMVNNISVNTPELANIMELDGTVGVDNFITRVHPEDKTSVEEAMTKSFVSGEYDCQYRYLGKEREKILWAHGIVTFKDGRPVKMKGTVQDITQLKKIEEELKKKTLELEKSNESLQQFASVASHDLKEPLRKMSMYSDMVLLNEDEHLSENSKGSLGKVKSSAIRMQRMIEDILSFSSITNDGKMKVVNLEEIVQEAMVILEESIRDKNARIICNNLPDVRVSGSQMRQLFQNLIANSLKFARKGVDPIINITHRYANRYEFQSTDLHKAERYHVISVEDNGIGFSQEHAEKIFGLFTRLHPQTTYEGSGLGLSICKRIAENHGGIIRAESKPGEGTTFIIVLPDR
jgi:PAS domain S-box-containing protein